MSKKEVLHSINELLNIPQFERIIHHKLEEIKIFLSDELEFYRSIKDGFREQVYTNMHVLDNDDVDQKPIQGYHFELNRETDDTHWEVVSIEPPLPPGLNCADILPREVIHFMADFKTDPASIQSRKKLCFPEIKGTHFDLQFVKYSDSHILGLIKMRSLMEREEESVNDLTTIHDYELQDADEETHLKEFLYFMRRYPALRIYFFALLQMKLKPLIMGKMVDINASSQLEDLS